MGFNSFEELIAEIAGLIVMVVIIFISLLIYNENHGYDAKINNPEIQLIKLIEPLDITGNVIKVKNGVLILETEIINQEQKPLYFMQLKWHKDVICLGDVYTKTNCTMIDDFIVPRNIQEAHNASIQQKSENLKTIEKIEVPQLDTNIVQKETSNNSDMINKSNTKIITTKSRNINRITNPNTNCGLLQLISKDCH